MKTNYTLAERQPNTLTEEIEAMAETEQIHDAVVAITNEIEEAFEKIKEHYENFCLRGQFSDLVIIQSKVANLVGNCNLGDLTTAMTNYQQDQIWSLEKKASTSVLNP